MPTKTKPSNAVSTTHVDVLIVGAGLSGIGAACHLVREASGKSFAILERRKAIGGTWDLFTYPGIRSDSDMYTFGYSFRPWTGTKVLADGASIKKYVEDTAREYGVDKKIQFGRKVLSAEWSSEDQLWTVTAQNEDTGEQETWTASFMIAGTGYYNYDQGYRPTFPEEASFKGQIVHPQHWPADLDYKGKKVVVIGSGATAVTLVPAMAPTAAHVTMLQRTPTYIMTVPSNDFVSAGLRRVLPEAAVYRLGRTRNIGLQRALFLASKSQPAVVKKAVLGDAKRRLGKQVDIKHFTPPYEPWDQRLCVVPDGDLFRTLRSGRASIVTDHIERFTPDGIRLKSGKHLEADIIISATGLNIQLFGGASITVDGAPVSLNERMIYKGAMVEGIPNTILIIGYTNASWTLKADIVSEYACRMLHHLDANGYGSVIARGSADDRLPDSVMGSLASGYVQRADAQLPRQGKRTPWRLFNDYLRDAPLLRYAPLTDSRLEFAPKVKPARANGSRTNTSGDATLRAV